MTYSKIECTESESRGDSVRDDYLTIQIFLVFVAARLRCPGRLTKVDEVIIGHGSR